MKNPTKLKYFPLVGLLIILISALWLMGFNSTSQIPPEDPAAQRILDKAIKTSKLSINDGIVNLQDIRVSNYTEYKKDYVLAKLYEEKGDLNKAIEIFEKLLDKNYPLKERVLFHYAYLNTKLGKDLLALKYFNKLIREFPSSHSVPQAKYYLAQAQLRLRLTKDAMNNLLSLRTQFPKTQYGIATNYYLGEYAYNNKKFNEALDYWRDYLKFSPDGRFANEISVSFSSLKSILEPSDYSLLGDVFFYKKDYAKAAYYYKIGNKLYHYYNLGYSLVRVGRTQEAFSYLKEFAYHYPKSKNAKFALFFASKAVPPFERKSFWEKVEKDVPYLAYYAIYKQSLLEENDYRREKKLRNLIELYPDTEFTLDAVWEIVWDKIKNKNYKDAVDIGSKYFKLSENSSVNSKSETRCKIGFWLGKICEIIGDNNNAREYYELTEKILFDNYYCFRAQNRLLALDGGKDLRWGIQSNLSDVSRDMWSIPQVVKSKTARKYFGATVSELIKLHQYDEAIDLIGKSKFPSKQITAWLKALNSEYDESISISSSVVSNYNFKSKKLMWKLAYPLHYWQYIYSACSKYKNVDPFFVCAVIRQESRYDRFACSISKACGLMQLIIPTARSISHQLNVSIASLDRLYDPQTNIVFGVHYLNGLIDELGNPLFVVAGYNAGPQAVKRWINKSNINDLDFFVEEIPYDETRNYVKRVFANYWTYLKLYKG